MIVKERKKEQSREADETAGLDMSCISVRYYPVSRCSGRDREKESESGRRKRRSEMLQALIINTPTAAAHETSGCSHKNILIISYHHVDAHAFPRNPEQDALIMLHVRKQRYQQHALTARSYK